MPRCPNCQYQIKRWLDADPCPECGEVPKAYFHTLLSSRQRSVVIIAVVVMLAAHLQIFMSTHVPDWRGMVVELFHMHPESLTILCYMAAILSPSATIYIFVLAFERNLSRMIPTIAAVCSLIPSMLAAVFVQMLLGLLI